MVVMMNMMRYSGSGDHHFDYDGDDDCNDLFVLKFNHWNETDDCDDIFLLKLK